MTTWCCFFLIWHDLCVTASNHPSPWVVFLDQGSTESSLVVIEYGTAPILLHSTERVCSKMRYTSLKFYLIGIDGHMFYYYVPSCSNISV